MEQRGGGPAGVHRDTARAVLHAVGTTGPDTVVRTQGHVLTVQALVSTLAVEAAVHHLDLAAVVPERPAAPVLAEVRRVADALLGTGAPADWDDVRWALLATGRATPTAGEATQLGDLLPRLPLFG